MILESLVDSLQEDTLPNITTKILAKKSDITEAAIYKHYKGKQDVNSFCKIPIYEGKLLTDYVQLVTSFEKPFESINQIQFTFYDSNQLH